MHEGKTPMLATSKLLDIFMHQNYSSILNLRKIVDDS